MLTVKKNLSDEMMQVYKTGVEYHFYHALRVLFIGVFSISMPSGLLNWPAIFLTIGAILFSGSLYILSVTGIKWLGAITPLGGISLITGWILLFVTVWKKTDLRKVNP